MISRKNFNKEINAIIKEGKIENITLTNPKSIESLFKKHNITLYEDFVDNYQIIFGSDNDLIFSKIQDFIYRMDLFCRASQSCNIESIDGVFHKLLFEHKIDFDLCSSCSFDSFDNETITEFEDLIQEVTYGISI